MMTLVATPFTLRYISFLFFFLSSILFILLFLSLSPFFNWNHCLFMPQNNLSGVTTWRTLTGWHLMVKSFFVIFCFVTEGRTRSRKKKQNINLLEKKFRNLLLVEFVWEDKNYLRLDLHFPLHFVQAEVVRKFAQAYNDLSFMRVSFYCSSWDTWTNLQNTTLVDSITEREMSHFSSFDRSFCPWKTL